MRVKLILMSSKGLQSFSGPLLQLSFLSSIVGEIKLPRFLISSLASSVEQMNSTPMLTINTEINLLIR